MPFTLPDYDLQYAQAGRARGERRGHELVHGEERGLISAKGVANGRAVIHQGDECDSHKYSTVNDSRKFDHTYRARNNGMIPRKAANRKYAIAP
jgi:hypothetical protein